MSDGPAVLVVDDEELIRWSLAEELRSGGYRPVEAGSLEGPSLPHILGAAPTVTPPNEQPARPDELPQEGGALRRVRFRGSALVRVLILLLLYAAIRAPPVSKRAMLRRRSSSKSSAIFLPRGP